MCAVNTGRTQSSEALAIAARCREAEQQTWCDGGEDWRDGGAAGEEDGADRIWGGGTTGKGSSAATRRTQAAGTNSGSGGDAARGRRHCELRRVQLGFWWPVAAGLEELGHGSGGLVQREM